jgi:cellulose biosynthesis protein BcsQ
VKLVTCCSFKGGAGKTTALMGLCSAWASLGYRVALFEADENRPLSKWKENALKSDTWDETCEVFAADDIGLLEAAYNGAEKQGFDFALADTHGGSSELNNTIIASSDFLLVPSMLTPLDIDEALATYRYIIELLVNEAIDIPTAILVQRIPVGRLTSSQKASSDLLNVLPQFDKPMHERDAFAAMKERGMMHLALANMEGKAALRLPMRNYATAMDELHVMRSFVDLKLGG